MPVTRSRTIVSSHELDFHDITRRGRPHPHRCVVCRRRLARSQVCSLCRIARALEPEAMS
jgi:hypothetical protein